MKSLGYALLVSLFAVTLSCGGCDSSSVNGQDNNGDGVTKDNNVYTDPTGAQCTEVTPCGNCDQDCRPAGNPFAPGSSGGDSGFDGDACGADTDCKGTCGGDAKCTGFGSGGFHGEACSEDSDCRGICDGTNTCEGFGAGTGYEGARCQSDVDCRGECGGTGLCEGGGTGGPGEGGGGGIGGGGGPGTGIDNNGTGGGGGGGTPDQNTCLDLEINLQHAIPTIALLIDQSGSTEEAFGGGLNRLEAAYAALMDPVSGLIMEIQNAFYIGLSLFSSYSDDVTCPELGDVRPELNNFDAIDRVFSIATPLGGTPTGEAIMGTLRQFDVHPEQGRKILLLATDGEPNTCANPYDDIGQPEAIAAVEQAYNEGIETIVLSVGDNVGRAHLEDMANAGSGLPIGGQQQARYYEANDPEQLKNEMQAIIDSARSCIFRVQGGVIDPGLVDQSTVTLDGNVLIYGDANGWNYHQNTQVCEGAKQCISLEGTACESIQDGMQHQILGDFLCTYYDPDNPPIGGGGGNGGPGSGGTIGGGGGGPMACANPGSGCSYDGDCCSGVCGGGTCITQ